MGIVYVELLTGFSQAFAPQELVGDGVVEGDLGSTILLGTTTSIT